MNFSNLRYKCFYDICFEIALSQKHEIRNEDRGTYNSFPFRMMNPIRSVMLERVKSNYGYKSNYEYIKFKIKYLLEIKSTIKNNMKQNKWK